MDKISLLNCIACPHCGDDCSMFVKDLLPDVFSAPGSSGLNYFDSTHTVTGGDSADISHLSEQQHPVRPLFSAEKGQL